MAQVPVLDTPRTSLAPLPGVRQQPAVGAGAFTASADQLAGLGAAAQQSGRQFGAIEFEMRQRADATRVDDALNQLTEQSLRLRHDKSDGYTSQTGYAALNRDSGQPLADEYAGKLKSTADTIAGTLSNDEQRRQFGLQANNVLTRFHGEAMSYEGQQYREYTSSVREATVSNATNALALNFRDPLNVQAQTTRIRASIEGGQDDKGVFIPGLAQMQGKSAAWAKEMADTKVSGAHTAAIKSALEQGDVTGAMGYFKAYNGQMTANDILTVQGTITKDFDVRQGAAVGGQVFETARPKMQPTDMTRLNTLVTGAESGGRRYGADGNILQGPVTRDGTTAKGEMQVMDATNKDPGYGVRPAANDSAEERGRVGRDYLAAMVKEYGGDVPKALAAYNAGPGRVNEAVTRAGARPGGDWLTFMPAETQAYVAKITKQFSEGGGQPQRPTLAELHNDVRTRLGPTASPLQLKTATDTVTQRFEDENKAITQRKDEIVAQSYQALQQNGGRFSELPVGLRTQLTQLAPDKVDEVMNFGKRMAAGDDTTDMRLYQRLASDPRQLTGLTDAQFQALRPGLSEADFKHFATERGNLLQGKTSNGPGDMNTQAINTTLNQRLASLRIDPTPKDGSEDAAQVGAIRRFVNASVLDAQRNSGKKMTDAETQAHIDGLFAKNQQFRGFFGGVTTQTVLAMKPSDIPTETRDALKGSENKKHEFCSRRSKTLCHGWP